MPANTRNITIAAHIDHGKTTFTDSLLATNDFLNTAQQGKIRLLDFLPIEQQRCITVKSSSVSLVHLSTNPWVQKQFGKEKVPALIQLFDSPGHCDFSQEVLSSLSLCDGAILLIDAVEGVRSQTYTIIRQLLALNLDMVLCINKLDRLFDELKMTGDEVYFKLLQIISDANQVIEEMTHKEEYFNLTQNVIFASAYQGWGFTLRQIAVNLSQMEILQNHSADEILEAFGHSDVFLGPNGLQKGASKSLFVQMVLDPIKLICDYLQTDSMVDKNSKKLARLFKQLNPGKELQGKFTSSDTYKEQFLSQTYPLGRCAMDCVLLNIPAPTETQNQYIKKIQKVIKGDFCGLTGKRLSDIDVFDESGYPQAAGSNRNFTLLRIIQQNTQQHLYVGSTFTAISGEQVKILGLYQPLGKTFKQIKYEQLSNGMIIGVETDIPLENNSLLLQYQNFTAEAQEDDFGSFNVKSSAVSTSLMKEVKIDTDILQKYQEYFSKVQRKTLQIQKPLIRVTMLPDRIQDYAKLYAAIKEFASHEMSVSWDLSPAGDIQLIVCGDVHLDLCVEALKKLVSFQFKTSQVHLMLRETVVPQTMSIKIERTTEFDAAFNERHDQMDMLLHNTDSLLEQRVSGISKLSQQESTALMPLYYQKVGSMSNIAIQKTSEICGIEVLILNDQLQIQKTKFFAAAGPHKDEAPNGFQLAYEDENQNQLFLQTNIDKKLSQCAIRAFRENVTQGPLCFEPMWASSLYFYVDKWNCEMEQITEDNLCDLFESEVLPGFYLWPTTQQTLNFTETIRSLFRQSLVRSALRVLEPHFQITIQGLPQHVQVLTQMLSKMRAQHLEFTDRNGIQADVPQEFALTLGEEIRSQTSGFAQLQFQGFDFILLEEDPRHNDVALTEEERIEFGEQGIFKKSDQKAVKQNVKLGQFDMDEDAGANVAKRVVNKVLRQKGLYIGDLVEDAEKQRTVKRNR